MGFLSKHDIIEVKDTYYEKIQVPEWGGEVYIYMLTAGERLNFENMVSRSKLGSNNTFDASVILNLIALCLRDEAGDILFSGDEVKELGKKNGKVIKKLAEKCMQINALGDDTLLEAKKN